MSIDNITAKILSESTENAKIITDKAKEDAKIVVEKANQEAEALKDRMERQAREDAEVLKNRKLSVADLEARKMRLAAKQSIIAKSFDRALEKLEGMKKGEYVDFLVKKIKEVSSDASIDGGVIFLNKKDRETIGKEVIEKVNAGAKNGASVTLGDETIGASGGFVLRSGSVEINSTLETMVGAVREDATAEVVGALFR